MFARSAIALVLGAGVALIVFFSWDVSRTDDVAEPRADNTDNSVGSAPSPDRQDQVASDVHHPPAQESVVQESREAVGANSERLERFAKLIEFLRGEEDSPEGPDGYSLLLDGAVVLANWKLSPDDLHQNEGLGFHYLFGMPFQGGDKDRGALLCHLLNRLSESPEDLGLGDPANARIEEGACENLGEIMNHYEKRRGNAEEYANKSFGFEPGVFDISHPDFPAQKCWDARMDEYSELYWELLDELERELQEPSVDKLYQLLDLLQLPTQ